MVSEETIHTTGSRRRFQGYLERMTAADLADMLENTAEQWPYHHGMNVLMREAAKRIRGLNYHTTTEYLTIEDPPDTTIGK